MSGRYDHLDESSVRQRPSRKGSRPRTKDRPAHEDAVVGVVTGVDRGRCSIRVGDRVVVAMRARELGRTRIVVGDRVAMVGDTSGEPDTLARIVRVEERRTVLRRSADDTDRVERVIVANADQLVVVTALADPEPRPRMVDRCLVAAYDAGLDPLLVLTKADLAPPEPFLAHYTALDVPHVVSRSGPDGGLDADGVEAVRAHLLGRTSVLVGHSGVGKSTLVNALVPEAERATGAVNAVTGRGRHTSTSAVGLELPGGGWVVDTPGVRSFGLGHVDPATFINHFEDLAPGTEDCPRGCSHDEPDCALDAWVAGGRAGPAGPARLESLRRLLRSRSGDER
ncbi:ribosome small subunit-dependent GTPase A [Ornithinimicrobium tianjinense]|uniref:Small ribosomal subunit biogenesis GTPase RsgA n=1 Tax=Ornithinimicrobium tianjinense TaxID=1195761 RepID=A0A917FA91_9MICO|nr:ribosome small subunit-dependent GTPase A [Ornithinimicrobium tianjinense]GGF59952.1 putative ribosome biogenesis GTPase RsgA [Ornithinimicrobium tianjinense]